MSLSLTDAKLLFRRFLKPKSGGPTDVARAQGLIDCLDAVAEMASSSVASVESLSITDATEAGRALLTAKDAARQLGLLDYLGFKAGQFGASQPAIDRVYGSNADSNAIAYILTELAKLQAAAAPAQPAAPTDGVVDDKLNSFQGTAVTGFPTLLEYEFSGIPGTTGWVPASTDNGHQVGTHLYIDGLTGNIDKGGVGMRVAASGNRPAGKVLLSAEPFTGAAVTTTPTTPTTPTVNITPDPPTVNFDTTTRILSASASDYGTNELEYRHNSGTVLAYANIQVDDAAHLANEWQYRVKAATGRNASAWAGNAAITAKTAASGSQPVTETAIPNGAWADDTLARVDTQGVQRNSFASLVVNVPAGQSLAVPMYTPVANQFGGNLLGAVINGAETALPIPAGALNQEIVVPGLSATSPSVVKFFAPASVRPGGSGAIISDNLLSLKSNGTLTFGAAPTGTYVIKVFGNSISCGGGANTPVFEGYTQGLRKKYAALGNDVRLILRTASADSLTAQYDVSAAQQAAFIQELGAGLTGTNGNTLFLPIGVNDKYLKNRSDADFLALYAKLLDDFHAAFPKALVVSMTPLPNGVANVSGFESGILALRASRYQWLEVLKGSDMLPASPNLLDPTDKLHPTTAGHAVLATNVFNGLRNHTGAYVPPPSGNGVFLEEFDGASRNAALWNEGYMGYVGPGVTMTQTNSSLQFTATYGNGHQSGYTSVVGYDMSGGKAFDGKIASLFNPVDQAVMNLMIGQPGGTYNQTVGMGITNRTFAFSTLEFGVLGRRDYNPSIDVYWRLREASGHLLMQTSADNSTWTTIYEMADPPFALTNVLLVVSAGASAPAPAGVTATSIGTAAWDWVRFTNPADTAVVDPGTPGFTGRVENTDASMSYPDGPGRGTVGGLTFDGANGRVVCNKAWTGNSITISYLTDLDNTFTDLIDVIVDGQRVGSYSIHQAVNYTGATVTFPVPAGNHAGFVLQPRSGSPDAAKANYFDYADLLSV